MSQDLVNARLLSAILVGISLAILLMVIVPREDSGDILIKKGETEQSELLLHVTDLTLDTYKDLLQLLGASFAVVSFLVGYQSRHRLDLPRRAWVRFSAGVLLLGVAMLLTLLGREKILTMVARNAVDFGATSLLYLRWSSYTAFTVAAVLISSFAVAAANAPRAEASSPFDEEEE
jgi:quinol-cytochrome oxidoreductase complex cytochrome b subunit